MEKPPAPAPLIAPGAPLEPYEAFVQQYPDYPGENGGDKLPGTKSNFIYACVYLNYLRPRKQLRDCLYDEFIRAYPCSYGEYVKRSRMEPMVAIKWFNQQKGPLLYNKYLVNRGNLSHILRSYPDEFARANELVTKKSGDDAGGDDIMIYTSSEDEGGSAIKSTAPRPSQYFKKISADLLKATPKKRSAKDLEKLREHFRRSKGTGAQDRRSSSGRFE
uniref:Uncharacterized protein n=1 Tax=Fusarium oxysporum (strain Fo5176) TaxID=660025 RepID=A0A0D2XBA1_FUSOF